MKKIRVSPKMLALHLAVIGAMVFLNFVLPQREPLAFALLYGALAAGLDPFSLCAGYLAASAAALSFAASLSAAIQSAFLLLIWVLYRRVGRRVGLERLLYAVIALLPFLFLFPHTGYALLPLSPLLWKLLLSALILSLSIVFEGGMSAIMLRVFRSRLSAGELAELAVMWLFAGVGVLRCVGERLFLLVALTLSLFAVVLLKRSAAVPFSAVLSLPLVCVTRTLTPLAQFTVYCSVALLLLPHGKGLSAIAFFLVFTGMQGADGLFLRPVSDVVLTLLVGLLPALLVLCLPERTMRRAEKTLLFYRERALPRMAVNRTRRAVGEQLYEVSSLFRDIETAFTAGDAPDRSAAQIQSKLLSKLCDTCPNRPVCMQNRLYDSLEKLIAVGRAKGRVNLIDLPVELSAGCMNSAGLLFSLNHLLAEYARLDMELASAREGRRLLAEQAHGISEVLRELALEQSEESLFSDEERRLFAALSKEGLLAGEIFLYGEGEKLTVSLNLPCGAEGKKVARAASAALGIPLSLSEKLPLTADRACFVLKRKPIFDAAFGVAGTTKEGQQQSGDTHSILKIDERRFLVALSDGMGSGEEARAVSDKTLSLIESFYKAKMPSATVLSTVNSLIAYSSEETFACLDLAAVNLDTGIADIVKIGSPVGFVLSGETLQVLEGESLPIGVLEAVHPACLRVELRADDFLIFLSDGVTTAYGSSSELCAYLSRLHPLNPQALAEEILGDALSRYGGRAEDDMTVVTVKLMECA